MLDVVDDGAHGGLVAVAVVTVASALAIGPVAAVVVGLVASARWRWPSARRALGRRRRRPTGWRRAYVALRQAVSKPSPAFEWPAEQATAHQPALRGHRLPRAGDQPIIGTSDGRAGARGPPAR